MLFRLPPSSLSLSARLNRLVFPPTSRFNYDDTTLYLTVSSRLPHYLRL